MQARVERGLLGSHGAGDAEGDPGGREELAVALGAELAVAEKEGEGVTVAVVVAVAVTNRRLRSHGAPGNESGTSVNRGSTSQVTARQAASVVATDVAATQLFMLARYCWVLARASRFQSQATREAREWVMKYWHGARFARVGQCFKARVLLQIWRRGGLWGRRQSYKNALPE